MITQRSLSWVRLFVLAACLAAAAKYYLNGELHHDPSYLLLATQRWLHGAVLYQDIMEINPPLIFYLSAPAVMASELLAVSSAIIFIIFVCILAGMSIAWCWTLLSRVESLSQAGRYLVVVACFIALVFAPAYNFGQREHLFIILALPYLMALGLSPLGLKPDMVEKAALGAFASFGIALKPYFLLPALLLTLALCWQQRTLRPLRDAANVALAVGCGAYFALVLAVHPQYWTTIVPMALPIYDSVATDTQSTLIRSLVPLLLVVATATISTSPGPSRSALAALSAAALGLLLAFAVQRKIWDYQILPFSSMSLILVTIAAVLAWRNFRFRPAHFALLAAIPAFQHMDAIRYGRYQNPYADAFSLRLHGVMPDWSGKSIIVLTTNVSAAFPLINRLGAEWAGRYPYQWLIAGALSRKADASCRQRDPTCAEIDAILDYARTTNVDDFALRRPDLVLIDEREQKAYLPAGEFSYTDFMSADERFDKIWGQYRKVDSVASYGIWIRASSGQEDSP